jgi:long-chain fatty acid transport protein
MKKVLTAAAALAVGATGAYAGGIERTNQSVGVLFEEGNYAEFSFSAVTPKVSGVSDIGTAFFAGSAVDQSSGNMAENYTKVGAAVKMQINDQFSAALIFDQPYGANVDYGDADATYFANGASATLESSAVTALLKYTLPSNASVFGGLRYQTLSAVASVPFVASYSVDGEKDAGVGYVIGAAYEKPEIALRVALTYNSSIKHELATTENSGLGVGNTSTTEINTPQSVNLEVQSGIAANTLLFGSVRWVEWSAFDITPDDYLAATDFGDDGLFNGTGSSLVSYADDRFAYTLGLGRKFSDTWSGAVTVSYEKTLGGPSSNLGPTDGQLSLGLGGAYTRDNMKISGGVSYTWIGDTFTGPEATPFANFDDNTAFGAGIKVGFTY